MQVQKWDKDPDDHTDETLLLQADYKYDIFGNRIEKTVDDDGDTVIDLTERYAHDAWDDWECVVDRRGKREATLSREANGLWFACLPELLGELQELLALAFAGYHQTRQHAVYQGA